MDAQGTRSTIDSPQAQQVFQIYHDLWKNGVVEPSVKDEKGATWTGLFPKGNIGVMPMPSTTLGQMPDNAKVKVGVAPIPGPRRGRAERRGAPDADRLGLAVRLGSRRGLGRAGAPHVRPVLRVGNRGSAAMRVWVPER
jgi:hypothetical protein